MIRTTSTLLIPTYNNPGQLWLILQTVLQQSDLPDEVLIAEDGEHPENREVVRLFSEHFPKRVEHLSQKDQGFRKAKALNKAMARAKEAYVIQVDGDCLLHPHFVRDHISRATTGLYLYGTRVHIRETAVPEVLKNGQTSFNFFHPGLKKRMRSLRIPLLSGLFKEQKELSSKFRGCNTSFWREDFERVNGYDEAFEGWGREDSDLAMRFHHAGLKGKRLKFCGIVYHLDHAQKDTGSLSRNNQLQNETRDSGRIAARSGLDQYKT